MNFHSISMLLSCTRLWATVIATVTGQHKLIQNNFWTHFLFGPKWLTKLFSSFWARLYKPTKFSYMWKMWDYNPHNLPHLICDVHVATLLYRIRHYCYAGIGLSRIVLRTLEYCGLLVSRVIPLRLTRIALLIRIQ